MRASLELLTRRSPSLNLRITNNKFMFRVLLPNGLNLTLEFEDASEDMSVAEFVRTVRREAEIEITEKGSRKIHRGSQVYVEDAMGEQIEEGNIICQASRNKPMIIALQVHL